MSEPRLLSIEEQQDILRRHALGATMISLAERYKVPVTRIYKLCNRGKPRESTPADFRVQPIAFEGCAYSGREDQS